jgi:hypothetical protein
MNVEEESMNNLEKWSGIWSAFWDVGGRFVGSTEFLFPMGAHSDGVQCFSGTGRDGIQVGWTLWGKMTVNGDILYGRWFNAIWPEGHVANFQSLDLTNFWPHAELLNRSGRFHLCMLKDGSIQGKWCRSSTPEQWYAVDMVRYANDILHPVPIVNHQPRTVSPGLLPPPRELL